MKTIEITNKLFEHLTYLQERDHHQNIEELIRAAVVSYVIKTSQENKK